MSRHALSDAPPPADDRAMLRAAVKNLGEAIARGECTPQLVELEALALICEDKGLPVEAARVQRWIAGGSDRGGFLMRARL